MTKSFTNKRKPPISIWAVYLPGAASTANRLLL
jgi:hypothetical protein